MKLSQPKIKHIIGSFRDSPFFPEQEDLEFILLNWYRNEGGAAFIHDDRKVPFNGFPVFDDKTFFAKFGEKSQPEIDRLIQKEYVRLIKDTGHSKYYELIKTEIYEDA